MLAFSENILNKKAATLSVIVLNAVREVLYFLRNVSSNKLQNPIYSEQKLFKKFWNVCHKENYFCDCIFLKTTGQDSGASFETTSVIAK